MEILNYMSIFKFNSHLKNQHFPDISTKLNLGEAPKPNSGTNPKHFHQMRKSAYRKIVGKG